MQRTIVGFEQDEVGDWVALLECGHRQHVRHRPPWQERPWVVTAEGRKERVGSPLECRECDEAEAPRHVEDAEVMDEDAGDPACWAHIVCPECGAPVEGGSHHPGCATP